MSDDARTPADVVLVGTGEPLYQLVTRREYIETIENLVDSIDVDIFVINNAGRVIVWNRSLTRKGLVDEDPIGMPFWEALPQFVEEYRGYQLGEWILEHVVGHGKTIVLDRYPLQLRTGGVLISDLKAYPLRGRGGQILGAVVVMNDISRRVELEQQLVRNARTTSLAGLGASMAHEIRNPLNSIQLNLQLIKEGLDPPVDADGLREIADLVLEESSRLNELITHFLEFARPPEPRMQRGSVLEPVERALKFLSEQARRAGIEIETDLPPTLPEVELDRHQLQQAVINIALNAIQHMPEGGRLTVRGRAHPSFVLLQIEDTGPGLTPEALNRAFDLFFSTREGGTGLGLPTANRIVEQHGGQLKADNTEDGGARFSISLPRAPTEGPHR